MCAEIKVLQKGCHLDSNEAFHPYENELNWTPPMGEDID